MLLSVVLVYSYIYIYIYVEAPQSFVQDTEGKVLGQVLGLHNTHIYICMCVYVHSIEMLVALKMQMSKKGTGEPVQSFCPVVKCWQSGCSEVYTI